MAFFIETAENLQASSFVSVGSRYISSEVLYYGDDKKITFETYKRQDVPFSTSDQFILLQKGMEYRPDIVSQVAYGTPEFWWQIMQANKIFDVFDFKAGRTIRVPNNIGF